MADIAKASASESREFMFESTGKRDVEEPLKQGNGAFKGKLHYVAEFVPAYAVRGIHFESGPSELQQAAERRNAGTPNSEEGGTVHDESDVEEDGAVYEGVTVQAPVEENESAKESGHSKKKSTDTTASARTTGTTGTTAVDDEKRPEEQGIEMSKEELLQHRAWFSILFAARGLCGPETDVRFGMWLQRPG